MTDLVMPEDVMSSPKSSPECLRTHPVHVANSNCWCNLWADQPCIRENMAHVLGLLQHNADEELWSACRDEHAEHEPAQQGQWQWRRHRDAERRGRLSSNHLADDLSDGFVSGLDKAVGLRVPWRDGMTANACLS